jgi:hypothetical protein
MSMDLSRLEIALVGVTRNGARFLPRSLDRMRRATHLFGRVHAFFVESDSTDATLDVLRDATRRWPELRYRSEGALRERLPQRTARIAHCRNVYLEELATNPLYAGVSHVIVADLDRVCRDIDAPALASCWAATEPWDACTANQGDYYYDIWALRHPLWCPGDAWQEQKALQPLLGKTAADELALFSRMVHIDPRRPLIEVDSAFGGLAVYKRQALLAGRYVGLDNEGGEVCEHVTLHAQLRAQGHRIFINPALINARTTRHAGRKKLFRTLRRRLWNALRGKKD